LRIGLHTGEVQLRDEGNYAGSTINKTARLRDLAHGGQTVLSAPTEQLVEDRLPEGAWLNDLGSHPVRDLPRPMRVAQLCHPDLRNDFPPLRAAKTMAAHTLPTQLTTFIGRGEQINEIRQLLCDNRLMTNRRRRSGKDTFGHRGRRTDDKPVPRGASGTPTLRRSRIPRWCHSRSRVSSPTYATSTTSSA